VGGQSVPDKHHPLPAVEDLELFQGLDKSGGVVAAGLEVEAQPRTAFGIGGVSAAW